MSRYVIKRIFMMIFVVLGVIVLVFSLLYFTPGDPARQVLGPQASDEAVQALRETLGLDDPFLVRLGRYIYNCFFRFDLGTSYRTKLPVMEEIMARFPVTLALGLMGMILSLMKMGIPISINIIKKCPAGISTGLSFS